jgi:hypothetical protein
MGPPVEQSFGRTLLLTPHALNVSQDRCVRVTRSAPSVAGATRLVANDVRGYLIRRASSFGLRVQRFQGGSGASRAETHLIKPATLLKFHKALVDRKYRLLFSSRYRCRKLGPKGPSAELIAAIIDVNALRCMILSRLKAAIIVL